MSGSPGNSTGTLWQTSPLGGCIVVQTTLLMKGIAMLNRADKHSERSGAEGLEEYCPMALFAVNPQGRPGNQRLHRF